ncbi:MAG TPA: BrnT family toxin [Rhizomicrobium sp.]|nr:BrnT family toxin [Rhizomicrobium sp.]
MLELEWDEEKRRANIQKHGLDFADAKHLDWDTATYIEDTRFPYPEPRYWAFAPWKRRLHLVAFCRRGARLRIISFRKANAREVNRYGK